MLVNATKVDLWSAMIPDQPGSIAQKLEGLAKAGANLDFIMAWRNAAHPDQSVISISPLTGDLQLQAAAALGFRRNDSSGAVRVEAPNEPGMGYRVTQALAMEGLNLKGISTVAVGNQVGIYVALDTPQDAEKAVRVLQRAM